MSNKPTVRHIECDHDSIMGMLFDLHNSGVGIVKLHLTNHRSSKPLHAKQCISYPAEDIVVETASAPHDVLFRIYKRTSERKVELTYSNNLLEAVALAMCFPKSLPTRFQEFIFLEVVTFCEFPHYVIPERCSRPVAIKEDAE